MDRFAALDIILHLLQAGPDSGLPQRVPDPRVLPAAGRGAGGGGAGAGARARGDG